MLISFLYHKMIHSSWGKEELRDCGIGLARQLLGPAAAPTDEEVLLVSQPPRTEDEVVVSSRA